MFYSQIINKLNNTLNCINLVTMHNYRGYIGKM